MKYRWSVIDHANIDGMFPIVTGATFLSICNNGWLNREVDVQDASNIEFIPPSNSVVDLLNVPNLIEW